MFAKQLHGLVLVVVIAGTLTGTTFAHADEKKDEKKSVKYPPFGKIHRYDARLDKIIARDATMVKLAEGFDWSEGPVWRREKDGSAYLLFSDIPQNSIKKWQEGEGISLFLKPAGYYGQELWQPEPGTNGLLVNSEGKLVMCEHGNRRISILMHEYEGIKETLVDSYKGKRLNSPNDGTFKSNGDLYFTDPPYGLPGRFDDRRRELSFCGVYRLSKKERKITLLTDEMTRPNGIAFSHDEKTLYVAQSDPAAALWMAFDVKGDGTIENGRVFVDVTDKVDKKGYSGLPDGMKTDKRGNLFATGPGGLYVFDPDGTMLGRFETGQNTGNCAWGDDGTVLYIVADYYLVRIQTLTKGKGF